ncbi:MAG: 4-hydroxybenzoyl-CoA thioesterase [Treponema sp. CETP13]|nr:MAG: 4-hydroxybenzoyl-CoA thioesterase [Treponema sp. CETP13]
MKNSAELVVRTYECDSYSHVNNANYLNYLEYGRMEYLHAINFDYKGLIAAGYYLYITRIDISYKVSAVLDDKLFVECEPKKFGKVSGKFHQRVIREDGTVCAEADVFWAIVSAETRRPVKFPQEFYVSGLEPDDK